MNAVTDLDAANLVIWPKWCYANSLKENKTHDFVLNNIMNMNNLNNNNRLQSEEKDNVLLNVPPHISKKSRRKASWNGPCKGGPPHGVLNGLSTDTKGHTKAERVSPDPGTESVTTHVSPPPSGSPKSPASHRTRTPSFSGTPPHPAFTPPTTTLHPPYDRFSPAALGAVGGLPGGTGAVKQMENLVARNCSDLMRSLAAKYNNSNPNDYFSSPRNNDFFRSSLPNLGHFKGVSYPTLGEGSALISSTTSSSHQEKKSEIPVSTIPGTLPQGISPAGAPPLFPGSRIPGFPGFPLVDVSSTQVLLNMVRNASVAQQPLENYLRGAVKRPADTPSSPLDLSSSVGAKKPKTDLGRSFDVKNLFPEGEKKMDDKAASSSPATSPTGVKTFSTPSPGTNLPSGRVSTGIPCGDRECPSLEGVLHWTVEDVCDFVRGIDLCAEYAEAFREQRIDGSSLPLLTEDHLTTSIHMKLGPALKLRSVLARKLGSCSICLHCAHCHSPPIMGERHSTSASSGR